MNEDIFNVQMRKFLKKTGITAQREIEQAVRAAIADGRLAGNEKVPAVMTLRIPSLGVEVDISDDIALHLVRPEAGSPGVSLHLYSRPFDLCHIYDPATGLASEKVLAYHSIHGQRCPDPGTIPSSHAHGSACL